MGTCSVQRRSGTGRNARMGFDWYRVAQARILFYSPDLHTATYSATDSASHWARTPWAGHPALSARCSAMDFLQVLNRAARFQRKPPAAAPKTVRLVTRQAGASH